MFCSAAAQHNMRIDRLGAIPGLRRKTRPKSLGPITFRDAEPASTIRSATLDF